MDIEKLARTRKMPAHRNADHSHFITPEQQMIYHLADTNRIRPPAAKERSKRPIVRDRGSSPCAHKRPLPLGLLTVRVALSVPVGAIQNDLRQAVAYG
jgi:hypothetical protein